LVVVMPTGKLGGPLIGLGLLLVRLPRPDLGQRPLCAADGALDLFGGRHAHRGADARALIRAIVAAWRKAFPDLRFDIEDEVVRGDAVVHLVTCSGTHTGTFEHPAVGVLAPSGRRFSVDHVHIHRVRDGRIVQHWGTRNDLAMLQQLGSIGSLPAAESMTSSAGWQRANRA
jgi:predicted ester cyclase